MAFPSDLVRTKDWGTEILTDSDLEGQFDLIINWVMAALDSTSGHAHEGTSNKSPKITVSNLTLASGALGDIVYHNGTSLVRLAGNTTTTKKYLTQTGDGAASAAPAWATLSNADLPSGSIVQIVNTQTGAVATGTTQIPKDDTIPQNTEGDQYMTLAITPISATNKLKIDITFNGGRPSNNEDLVAALFQDTTADALAVAGTVNPNGNQDVHTICFTHYMTAGTTSETTFKVRGGSSYEGTTTFNGFGGNRKYGGVCLSSITITEIKA